LRKKGHFIGWNRGFSSTYAGPLLPNAPDSYHLEKTESDETRYDIGIPAKELTIPLSAFYSDASALQVVVTYLHDRHKLSFGEIARALERDYQTVWTTYRSHPLGLALSLHPSRVMVPLSIFKDATLGPLEALVLFLRTQGLRYVEIATLLKRDQRTIWTAVNRAQRKLSERGTR
jgi:DNA-directed RNA polymerase specialized sigma24 family protein